MEELGGTARLGLRSLKESAQVNRHADGGGEHERGKSRTRRGFLDDVAARELRDQLDRPGHVGVEVVNADIHRGRGDDVRARRREGGKEVGRVVRQAIRGERGEALHRAIGVDVPLREVELGKRGLPASFRLLIDLLH